MTEIERKRTLNLAKKLFVFFLILLVYDGALRKWFFYEFERLIFIAKDIFLIASFALVLFAHLRTRLVVIPRLVWITVGAYSFYVVIAAFNPKLPNYLVGIWGIKTHLFYITLLLVIPGITGSLSNLYKSFEKAFPWLVIPVCLIALVQFFSAPDSIINNPVRGGSFFASYLSGGFVRSSGTFSYITGFTWFLQSTILLGFFLLIKETRVSYRIAIPVILLIFALPTNGSRAAVVILFVSVGMILTSLMLVRMVEFKQIFKYVLFSFLVPLFTFATYPDIWHSLTDRFLNSSHVAGDSYRYLSSFTNAFSFLSVSGWFGFGSGSANQAAPFLVMDQVPFAWLPDGIGALGFEEESGRLVLELGTLGWLISLTFRISMVILALFMLLKGVSKEVKWSAIFVLPTMALGVHMGSGVFVPPVGAAFYWFCVAVLVMAWNEHRDGSDAKMNISAGR